MKQGKLQTNFDKLNKESLTKWSYHPSKKKHNKPDSFLHVKKRKDKWGRPFVPTKKNNRRKKLKLLNLKFREILLGRSKERKLLPITRKTRKTFSFLYKKKWRRYGFSKNMYLLYRFNRLLRLSNLYSFQKKLMVSSRIKKNGLVLEYLKDTLLPTKLQMVIRNKRLNKKLWSFLRRRRRSFLLRNERLKKGILYSARLRKRRIFNRILNSFLEFKKKLYKGRFYKPRRPHINYPIEVARKLSGLSNRLVQLNLLLRFRLWILKSLIEKTSYSFGVHSRLDRRIDDRYW